MCMSLCNNLKLPRFTQPKKKRKKERGEKKGKPLFDKQLPKVNKQHSMCRENTQGEDQIHTDFLLKLESI